MKKSFFYLLTMLLMGTTLSSCLGDTESYFESTDFGVISTREGTKVATFLVNGNQIYYLNSSSIDAYGIGDVIRANYKINFDNINNLGIVNADYINVVPDQVYPNNQQSTVTLTAPDKKYDQFNLINLDLNVGIVDTQFSDRIIFTYGYRVKSGETVKDLKFYYDESAQTSAPENSYIIDVRLEVDGSSVETEGTPKTYTTVANFSSFKVLKEPNPRPKEGVNKTLIFRFNQENKDQPSTINGRMYYAPVNN